MPGKGAIFTPSSILFRPRHRPACGAGFWWRRRVPPPGPMGLLHRPFIAISGRNRQSQYRCDGAQMEEDTRRRDRYRPGPEAGEAMNPRLFDNHLQVERESRNASGNPEGKCRSRHGRRLGTRSRGGALSGGAGVVVSVSPICRATISQGQGKRSSARRCRRQASWPRRSMSPARRPCATSKPAWCAISARLTC